MVKTILVSGSLAYDRIMNFPDHFKNHIMPDKLHVLNVSFVVETVEERFGGTAGNIAYNLQFLGVRPLIVSALGEDGDRYKIHLEKEGIDTSLIAVMPERKTAFANIITDLDDNQISAFHAGALDDVSVSSAIPKEAEFAIVSPETKTAMMERVAVYKEAMLPYMFDPAQQIPRFNGEELRECITGARVVIGNDYEMSLIERKTGWSILDISKRAKVAVATYGKNGSKIYTGKETITVDAIRPRKFIDPTGAGDAYRAGFAAAFLEERPFAECGRIGSWVASRAIEYYGAQEHRFTRYELEAFINNNNNP